MTTNESYDLLPSLLPSHSYTLVYALPLFFISIILTFAGSFLTLDRTRSFAPSTAAPPSTQKPKRACSELRSFRWSAALEGGVGGLAAGYCFGVHFSTFLVLLIPNTTSSGPLNPKAFIAVWFLSSVPCTLLGGRWKYAAIVLSGVSGYATLALSLSVIAHPSLLTRIALTAVFAPIGIILCVLPFPRIARASLRVACAGIGAFGMVLSIALMARVPAWGNVWERFWVRDGDDWGTSKEKGLSTAYCLLLIFGAVCDWLLHYKFGENPDEKWDRYLADYTTTLPNDHNRAGTFTPLVSFWDKLFGQHRAFAPVVPDTAFSREADLKLPLTTTSPELKLSKQRTHMGEKLSDVLDNKSRVGFLRKKGSTRVSGMKRTRRAIRFRPLDEEASSSDSDSDPFLDNSNQPQRSRSIRTDSSATLTNSRTEQRQVGDKNRETDEDAELKPPPRNLEDKGVPEYSDYESDAGAPRRQEDRSAPGWTPEFIRRHSARAAVRPSDAALTSPSQQSLARQQTPPTRLESSPTPIPFPMPMTSVPATPSLIRAVERINAAHESLYPSQTPSGSGGVPSGLPAAGAAGREHRDQAWNSFWTEVKVKAQS